MCGGGCCWLLSPYSDQSQFSGARGRWGDICNERVNISLCSLAKEEEDLNLLEWYFILAYCVGGVLVVAGLVVVSCVCWLARDQCCDTIAKKKPTRVRVRRSKVTLGKYVCDSLEILCVCTCSF